MRRGISYLEPPANLVSCKWEFLPCKSLKGKRLQHGDPSWLALSLRSPLITLGMTNWRFHFPIMHHFFKISPVNLFWTTPLWRGFRYTRIPDRFQGLSGVLFLRLSVVNDVGHALCGNADMGSFLPIFFHLFLQKTKKVFTFYFSCDIITMLHKNEYYFGFTPYFWGSFVAIRFLLTQPLRFGKNADSAVWVRELNPTNSFLCSSNWSLRFSVRWLRLPHFLIFWGFYEKSW